MREVKMHETVSWTRGGGWEHSGHTGRVVAVGPDVASVREDETGECHSIEVSKLAPGRVSWEGVSSLEWASRIDDAAKHSSTLYVVKREHRTHPYLVADVGAIDVDMCWGSKPDEWEEWRARALAQEHGGLAIPSGE